MRCEALLSFFLAAGCGSWDRLLKYGASAGTHSTPSYDCDTPSDALEDQIGALVCPLCIEIIKPISPNLEIWGIGKICQNGWKWLEMDEDGW